MRTVIPQVCKETRAFKELSLYPSPEYVEGKTKCPNPKCKKGVRYRMEWCNSRWLFSFTSCDNFVYQEYLECEFWRTRNTLCFSKDLVVNVQPWGDGSGFDAFVSGFKMLSIDMQSRFSFSLPVEAP